MSKIRTKKIVFFNDKYVNSTIMVDLFFEILLVLEFQLTKTYFGTFSYKAHFRPQISSNEGFITEFAVDQRKSFSKAEMYFFKGYCGRYLNSLNLSLKMLLYEKGVLDIFSDE